MKYLVIGAGGTGASLTANLSEAGRDITAIARGPHLAAMQQHGLRMETTRRGNYTVYPVKAFAEADYQEQPEVIFVCVKGYSLPEVVPLIERVARPSTIVIPILNIYGTGEKLQRLLQHLLVTDSCIYIAAEIKQPGVILQKGNIFRVVFGVRESTQFRPELWQIAADLEDSGIDVLLSEQVKADTFKKFTYVSPLAACEIRYNTNAGGVREPGEARAALLAMMREIIALGNAMVLELPDDLVEFNFTILSRLSPTATTSLQRDFLAGRPTEIDGLIFQVVRWGREYGVKMPTYERIAAELGFR